MDMHIGRPAHVPQPAAVPAPAVEPATPQAERKSALAGVYVLVEDLEFLWRTGTSRQVLALRWQHAGEPDPDATGPRDRE